ncbi:hypothetical protein [Chitinophaga sancti]|uniref:Uncharacterized protein n=1 Tax=Chitinophaga sancti TaxID=1004 RepID=A0A1K1NIN4_9BACT|nr:hypothetical protein [Chitinophaga sancti]WQD63190.1 hypothetical protein U0033_02200 [Chitinophaga sancti]WQG91184.1 hypothetical protein SR876_06715 [Chitinophaga sancti]SFW35188.1 hypothetical protein SAMN05661012_01344 [Chitinophaga sancti]
MIYMLDTQIQFDAETIHAIPFLFLFVLIAVFLVIVIRSILDYRFKIKMVEKGVSENLAVQLLSKPKQPRQTTMKWAILLGGTGLGVLLVALNGRLDIYSLAIMLFALSASFLGYYIYVVKSE